MKLREKLSLIVIVSILLTSIPVALWVTSFSKEKLLNREIEDQLAITQNQVEVASEHLAHAKPKLLGLARLLENELSSEATDEELSQFYQIAELNEDGVWRNKKHDYDGLTESGIFLPNSPELSDTDKVFHIRIKRVFDIFGTAATRIHENIWYLSPNLRSELIFDTTFPNFVFEQLASNDYTQTPWVTLTSPAENPDKSMRFTPPLFDPVTGVWMVSAILPLYVDDKWVGSLGEDMQLTKVLAFMFNQQSVYDQTQHFLTDNQGNFILAGQWQDKLESSETANKTLIENESGLQDIMQKPTRVGEFSLLSRQVTVDGKSYIAIGTSIAPMGWHYIKLISIDAILKPIQQQLVILFIAILAVTLLSGWVIRIAVNRILISRISKLTTAMSLYESGKTYDTDYKDTGKDEISQTVSAFSAMAERIDKYIDQLAESQQALIESENRWRIALKAAGDGVWELNVFSGEVIYSENWPESLGYENSHFPRSFHD
ncbi:hypothetical protein LCGC14_1526430, partial [marine sediment metagenome]